MIVWKGQKEDVQKQQSRILGHVSWCRPVQLQNQGQWLKEPSPPSQLQKTQSPGAVKYDREGWVVRVRGWGHKIWKQTQNWGIQPSHKWSRLWCHLQREGMEVERSTEIDWRRHHQVLKEGNKFESSFLRLDRCCFLALLRLDTQCCRLFGMHWDCPVWLIFLH